MRRRQAIRFERRPEAFAGRQIAHRLDREVLEGDPDEEGDDEIQTPGGEDSMSEERQGDGDQERVGDGLPQRPLRSLFTAIDGRRSLRGRAPAAVGSEESHRARKQSRDRPHDIHDPHALRVTCQQIENDAKRTPAREEQRDGREDRQPGGHIPTYEVGRTQWGAHGQHAAWTPPPKGPTSAGIHRPALLP
jgi:hypothetical protein